MVETAVKSVSTVLKVAPGVMLKVCPAGVLCVAVKTRPPAHELAYKGTYGPARDVYEAGAKHEAARPFTVPDGAKGHDYAGFAQGRLLIAVVFRFII